MGSENTTEEIKEELEKMPASTITRYASCVKNKAKNIKLLTENFLEETKKFNAFFTDKTKEEIKAELEKLSASTITRFVSCIKSKAINIKLLTENFLEETKKLNAFFTDKIKEEIKAELEKLSAPYIANCISCIKSKAINIYDQNNILFSDNNFSENIDILSQDINNDDDYNFDSDLDLFLNNNEYIEEEKNFISDNIKKKNNDHEFQMNNDNEIFSNENIDNFPQDINNMQKRKIKEIEIYDNFEFDRSEYSQLRKIVKQNNDDQKQNLGKYNNQYKDPYAQNLYQQNIDEENDDNRKIVEEITINDYLESLQKDKKLKIEYRYNFNKELPNQPKNNEFINIFQNSSHYYINCNSKPKEGKIIIEIFPTLIPRWKVEGLEKLKEIDEFHELYIIPIEYDNIDGFLYDKDTETKIYNKLSLEIEKIKNNEEHDKLYPFIICFQGETQSYHSEGFVVYKDKDGDITICNTSPTGIKYMPSIFSAFKEQQRIKTIPSGYIYQNDNSSCFYMNYQLLHCISQKAEYQKELINILNEYKTAPKKKKGQKINNSLEIFLKKVATENNLSQIPNDYHDKKHVSNSSFSIPYNICNQIDMAVDEKDKEKIIKEYIKKNPLTMKCVTNVHQKYIINKSLTDSNRIVTNGLIKIEEEGKDNIVKGSR